MFPSRNNPRFVWDHINRRKVQAHQIEEDEVEEVFTDPDVDIRRTRKGEGRGLKRYVATGRTESGRLLKVPFELVEGGVRPVTAYDAGARDYRLYYRQ